MARSLPWFALSLLVSSQASAATLTVGAGKTYADPCAAVAAAAAGDTIEVSPGTYTTACKVGKTLTVRGVGGRPVIKSPSPLSNGKGIFAVEGGEVDFTAENLEFMGATVGDKNGAGIRFQARDLTVRDCVFHDNDNGILTSPQRNVTIESSEFYANGFGDGQSHNLYIGGSSNGSVAKLIFRYNWSHGAKEGHLLKSRAEENWILFNRISDETTSVSDNVDLPSGGKSYLIGNLFEQANSSAGNMIRIGEEGNKYGDATQLLLVHNTFVNHRNKGAFAIVAGSVTQPTVIANNLFFGQGSLPTDKVTSVGNQMRDLNAVGTDLVSDAKYDYHLKAGAAAIDKGVDVSAYLGGVTLEQYVHPLDHAPRTKQGGAPDSGAYEFGDTGEGMGGAGGMGQGGAGMGGAGQGGAGQGGAGSSAEGGQGGAAAGEGGAAGGQAGTGTTAGQGGASAGTTAAGGQGGAAAGTSAAGGTGGTGTAAGQGGASAGQGGSAAAGAAGAVSTAGSAGSKAGSAGSAVSGASGQTATPAEDSDDSGGCQASSGPASGWGLGGLVVAVLSLGRRRRRTSR